MTTDEVIEHIHHLAAEGVHVTHAIDAYNSPLALFTSLREYPLVETLLNLGGSPDREALTAGNGCLELSLHMAAWNDDVTALDLLLGAPCRIAMEYWSTLAWTPLQFAVMEAGVTAVQRLLDAGADVHAWQSVGRFGSRVPLAMAVDRDAFDIARLLIEHGADPDLESGAYDCCARRAVYQSTAPVAQRRRYIVLFDDAQPAPVPELNDW